MTDKVEEIQLSLTSMLDNARIVLAIIGLVAESLYLNETEENTEKIEDFERAVHEAFLNAVKHGYGGSPDHKVKVIIRMATSFLEVEVQDSGKGTDKVLEPPDVPAMVEKGEPSVDAEGNRIGGRLFYAHPFTDECEIKSVPGKGTTVRMKIYF